MAAQKIPVIIIGGGATGLMLGCLLAKRNVPFLILEKNATVSQHSRSIGIHPPSVKIFSKIGLEHELLNHGNKVTTGIAFAGDKMMGEIDFRSLKSEHPFILTLSQSITEKLLEQQLLKIAPESLIRNTTVKDVEQKEDFIYISTTEGAQFSCNFLIGCDGKNSTVRELAGIAFDGLDYPDTYIMGDFEDNVGNRNEAHVYLTRNGLVESFPHGEKLRRWVLKTDKFIDNPDAEFLALEAKKRTGKTPDLSTNCMLSSFGVQKRIASTFRQGNILLAGDAAHVVSPIGGQGMNLGWLDAAHLAEILAKPNPKSLDNYSNVRRHKAIIAAKRADFNMKMGRAFTSIFLKKFMVRLLLVSPIQSKLLKQFTMHGLES